MPLYASPPPYVWHKVETHTAQYSALPLFVPPQPPILMVPHNPFLPNPPKQFYEPPPEDQEAYPIEETPPAEAGIQSLNMSLIFPWPLY